MKEYFFLKGKDQNGPFTVEQLVNKKLTNDTLIWTEGMDNWQKLKDIPDLMKLLKPKSVPPPPPIIMDENIIKTEVSGQLKVTTDKTPNSTLEAIKPSKTTLFWLIIWCGFHLFALLMSYSGVDFFNKDGYPKTESFWPFVKYNSCEDLGYFGFITYDEYYSKEGVWMEYCFKGIFSEYDKSEFAFYVFGAIIIYLLVRISKKQELSNT
jgi:hypothetical protein